MPSLGSRAAKLLKEKSGPLLTLTSAALYQQPGPPCKKTAMDDFETKPICSNRDVQIYIDV